MVKVQAGSAQVQADLAQEAFSFSKTESERHAEDQSTTPMGAKHCPLPLSTFLGVQCYLLFFFFWYIVSKESNFLFYFFYFYFYSYLLEANYLQYCSGFCHTLT